MPTYIVKVTHVSRNGDVTVATPEIDAPSEKVAVESMRDRYPQSAVESLGEAVEITEEPSLISIFKRRIAA